MQIALPMLILGAAAVAGYGWMMDHKISLAGPVVMLFVFGYCMIAASQCLNILMVDIYPGKPATATAANNVTRCLLGAGASAAIIPMGDAIGNGWAYTVLAIIFALSTAGPIASMKYGIKWRKARKEKERRRREAREAKHVRNAGESV